MHCLALFHDMVCASNPPRIKKGMLAKITMHQVVYLVVIEVLQWPVNTPTDSQL